MSFTESEINTIMSHVQNMIDELCMVNVDRTECIFRDMPSSVMLTGLHAIIRSMFCYSRGLRPGSHVYAENKRKCKHGNLCGYVIGYGVYKWFLSVYHSEIAEIDKSSGCSFGHDHAESMYMHALIIDYLRRTIPNPRNHKVHVGFQKIKEYVTEVLEKIKEAANKNTALLYDEEDQTLDIPKFREILAYKIGSRNRYGRLVQIILTRDKDLMLNPPIVKTSDGPIFDRYDEMIESP